MMRAVLLSAWTLAGCQVAQVGERLFACDAEQRCPAGYQCLESEGLCLRDGEQCASNITLDQDAGGAFDVTVEGDLSLYARDQDITFCDSQPKGPDVFYGFTGAGPFEANITPVGNWKPVISVQKCDPTSSVNECGSTDLNIPELDPGYWRIAVSSLGTTGGPFTLRVRAAEMVTGDYCTVAVRLAFVPGADGGLTATTRFDTSRMVRWTQGFWGCGGSLPTRDAVFVAQGRADGGRVTARTTAPFRHWIQWRANDDDCPASSVVGCTEAQQLSDGGWRATLSGPNLSAGNAWLWVGGVGSGGFYDVQVDQR